MGSGLVDVFYDEDFDAVLVGDPVETGRFTPAVYGGSVAVGEVAKMDLVPLHIVPHESDSFSFVLMASVQAWRRVGDLRM
jgi:hypothetical protein